VDFFIVGLEANMDC